jgi:hypothetical protein
MSIDPLALPLHSFETMTTFSYLSPVKYVLKRHPLISSRPKKNWNEFPAQEPKPTVPKMVF